MADEQNKEKPKETEGSITKLARTGLILLGVSKLAKHTNVAVLKQEVTLGLIGFGVSASLSNDDDLGGDLAAASFLTFGKLGMKHLNLKSTFDPDSLNNIYKKVETAQTNINKVKVASMSFGDKYSEVMEDIASKRQQIDLDRGAPPKSSIFGGSAGDILKTAITTAVEKIGDNITFAGRVVDKYKSTGATGLLESATNTKLFQKARQLESEGIDLNTILSKDLSLGRDAGGESGGLLQTVLSKFDMVGEDGISQLKHLNKMQQASKDTSLTSMFGMYTKRVGDGPAEIDFLNIIKDKADNLESLNKLANRFNSDDEYSSKTEEKFVQFLQDKGFGKLVEESYNKSNKISVGEVFESFKGKDVSSPEFGIGEIFSKGLDRKLFEVEKLSSDNNKEIISDMKNIKFLEKFSFTDVVEKNLDTGTYIDKTAFHSGIAMNKVLGSLENVMPAFYKVPLLGKKLNIWNPASLIDSKNSIKDIVENEFKIIKTAGSNRDLDTFILGNDTIDVNKVTNVISGMNATHSTIHKDTFASISHKKIISDSFEEEFKVARINKKNVESWDDISYRFGITNKTKGQELAPEQRGFKQGLENLTYSHINPLPVRYDQGKGFRYVKGSEGYYKEGHILSEMTDAEFKTPTLKSQFVKNNVTSSEAVESFLSDNSLSDFNSDMIKVDNARVKNIKKASADILVSDLLADNSGKGMELIKKHGTDSLEINDISALLSSKYGVDYKPANIITPFLGTMSKAGGEIPKEDIIKTLNKDEILLANIAATKNIKEQVLKAGFGEIEAKEAQMLADIATTKVIEKLDAVAKGNFGEGLDKHKMVDLYNKSFVPSDTKHSPIDVMNVEVLRQKLSGELNPELFSYSTDGTKRTGAFKEALSDINKYADEKVPHPDFPGVYTNRTLMTPEYIKNFTSFLENASQAENNAKKTVYENLTKDFGSSNNVFSKYFSKNSIESTSNVYNKDYEMALGYEFNKIANDDLGFIKEGIPMIDESLAKAAGFISEYGTYNHKGINIGESIYSGKTLDALTKAAGIDIKVSSKEFKGYEYYNKMSKEITDSIENDIDIVARGKLHKHSASYDGINKESYYDNLSTNKLNYNQLVKDYEDVKYVNINKNFDTRMVVENTLSKALNEKKMLDKIGVFIKDMIFGEGKNIIKLPEGYTSAGGQLITRPKTNIFSVTSHATIKGVQDSLETIGIERIPSSHFNNSPIKNFLKYRVVPLIAIASGAVALDSFTDAVTPDFVPVVGHGIVGAAASTYAHTRIGLQYAAKYTGLLSLAKGIEELAPGIIDNGILDPLDLLMDPTEMKEVYLEGKETKINKNRFWFTSGRQSAAGEEFGQYRPSLLYLAMNRDEDIWDSKAERFLREDFLPTKLISTIIDPYAKERHAYENFGAVYPKTEQLFTDVPIIGELLSATIGEMIKPTQFVNEEDWRVGENLMINPNYNASKDPEEAMFMEFNEDSNIFQRLARAGFKAKEDLKSFAGLPGYMLTMAERTVFGATNPYQNDVVLSSIDKDTDNTSALTNLQLGDLFGVTEPVRRLLDSSRFGEIAINPTEQNVPDWMPEELKRGNNVYMSNAYARQFLETDNSEDPDLNQQLSRLRTLSMYAPNSTAYIQMNKQITANSDDMTSDQLGSLLSSNSFARGYGQREYRDTVDSAGDVSNIDLKIDEMVSAYEFKSGGKRYKFEGIESNFNKMSERLGSNKAKTLMKEHVEKFKEGSSYKFEIGSNAAAVTGIDNEGMFIYINDPTMNKSLGKDSAYNGGSGIDLAKHALFDSPLAQTTEKWFGKKSAYNEWSYESVKTPYFRDWDDPVDSFIAPLVELSGSSIRSAISFKGVLDDSIEQNNQNSVISNLISKTAMARGTYHTAKSMLGLKEDTSSQYDAETKVQDVLEYEKLISGDKSFYNMTNNERLSSYKQMMNDGDANYFDGLVNTRNEKEREKILNQANERTSIILKSIWEAQAQYMNVKEEFEKEVVDVNYAVNNEQISEKIQSEETNEARLLIKSQLNIKYSKMDMKRLSVVNSYRGSDALKEGKYISSKLVNRFQERAKINSTIYPKGTVEINSRG